MSNAATTGRVEQAGARALLSAADAGDAARVSSLAAAGARADARLSDGETPLMRAAARGYADVARALLDAGADVNARRADGFTPLVLAVFFGQEEVVRLLLERGADKSARTRLGTTAEAWAAARGFDEIAALLRRADDGLPAASTPALSASAADASGANDLDASASAANVSVRGGGRVPAHPSKAAFNLGGFLRSWQASVGVAMLLVAVAFGVFAARRGGKTAVQSQQPATAAQSPSPQAVAQQPAPPQTLPAPQASPALSTTDTQAGSAPAQVPGATYGAPASAGQPFYYSPPNPGLANAPREPTVISESGTPATEDASRRKGRGGATPRETPPAAPTPNGETRDNQNTDDAARAPASPRAARPTETQPARPPPPPAPTPERGKVIQWPPQ